VLDPPACNLPARRPSGPNLDILWTHVNRNLRRVVACAAADHLQRAARILHQAPTVDGIMLAGNKTAEVITVLAKAAAQTGAPLPVEATDAIRALRVWSLTMKEEISQQERAATGQQDHPAGPS